MKKLLLLSGLWVALSSAAQDCTAWLPMEKGKVVETSHFNAKGKLQDVNTLEVLSSETTSGGAKARVKTVGKDAKGKETTNMEFDVWCNNGAFYVDMKQFLDQRTMEAYQSMEMKFSGNEMVFPPSLEPGTNMPDAEITMEAFMNGMKLMTLNIRMYNRKAVERETIKTAAGTFDCMKITYDSDVKIGMANKTYSYITWYAPNIGAVKTEFYNKGKLDGYSEVTSIR